MNDTVVPRTENQTRWGPLILVVAAILLYLAVRSPATDLSDWGGDLDDALREASKSGHPVLVAFYMPGCAPCTIMDRTVLSNSDVKRALHDYIRVRLDATVQTDLARQYEVYATPTFTVVDAQGRLLSKREGTLTVEEFVQFLNRAARLLSAPRPAPGGAGT
ncbi:MAG: thioredoxin family protein [Planctomycetes bacterium]|nr:thioredoxin family protein [Planctomycetota bacterium]